MKQASLTYLNVFKTEYLLLGEVKVTIFFNIINKSVYYKCEVNISINSNLTASSFKIYSFVYYITGLPHTQGTQGIQGNSGNFLVEENLREF